MHMLWRHFLAKSILLYSCIMFSKKIEASRRHEKFSILEWGQLLIVPICNDFEFDDCCV